MRRLPLAALLLLPALAACGQPAPVVEVQNAWTRATAGDATNAAVFMTIASTAGDRLVAASTPVAGKTDLMTMQGGTSAMQRAYVDAIDLPAGRPVSLTPAGLHVWLAGLNRPLRAGESFPLVREFEHAGERRVTVSVIAPAAPAPGTAM